MLYQSIVKAILIQFPCLLKAKDDSVTFTPNGHFVHLIVNSNILEKLDEE